MPQYLYQLAYTSESLAAQIKNPQDRLELVGKQLVDAVGAHIVGGGYSFGEYDISIIVDAADDVTMAAVALAIAAGGAVKAEDRPGPHGRRPASMHPVLAHTRKPLIPGLHTFATTWTMPTGLPQGTTLWLVTGWTTRQENASVGQGVAELVTPR